MGNSSELDLEEVKKIIRATVISSPNRRMTIRDLLEQYKCVEDREIPFQEFGFCSAYDFLLTIPDTIQLLDRSNRNSFLVPVTTAETEHIDRLVRYQKPPKRKSRRRDRLSRGTSFGIKKPVSTFSFSSNRKVTCDGEERRSAPKVPEKVISRLAKLLTSNKLTWTENPLREYKETYHEELQPKHFGFQNESEFMKYLDCRYKDDSSFQKVVDLPLVELSYAPNKEILNSQPPRNEALPGMVTYDPFPAEVCNGDFNLGTDPSSEDLKAGDRVDVNLGEVFSLGKFYIILKSKMKVLDSLMVDLNKFYDYHNEKYMMPISLITTNLLCACVYSKNSQWHRARIMNHFHSLKSAKICFIDYGTTELVSTDKLRYLHKDFAKHPTFCIKAKLSGIQPKSGDCYSDSVNRQFLRLYGSTSLVAEIVRKLQRGYEIFLDSTDGERKVSVHEDLISKELVERKGAQKKSQAISVMSKLDFSKLRFPLPFPPSASGGVKNTPPVYPQAQTLSGPPLYSPWLYPNNTMMAWTFPTKPHAFPPARNYLSHAYPYPPMPWYPGIHNPFYPPAGLRPPFRSPPVWYNSEIPNPSSVAQARYPGSASKDEPTKLTHSEKKSVVSNESISATSDYGSCDSKANTYTDQAPLESELNEFLANFEDSEDEALRERRAVENELKRLLSLNDDESEDENFAFLSNLKFTPPTRITELNASAEEFVPKNAPKIESPTTDTKVTSNTNSGPSKKIRRLNELRAFVMQQQMKSASS